MTMMRQWTARPTGSWTNFGNTSFMVMASCPSANGAVQDRLSMRVPLRVFLQQRRHIMPKIESEKAAKAGHVLFRYMRARQRFAENVDDPLPAHELAA